MPSDADDARRPSWRPIESVVAASVTLTAAFYEELLSASLKDTRAAYALICSTMFLLIGTRRATSNAINQQTLCGRITALISETVVK
jgi:hypothetical protein